jgi:signal transduction histidine kinase
MAIEYLYVPTHIHNSEALHNLPKFGFLVWKHAIWQPWTLIFFFLENLNFVTSLCMYVCTYIKFHSLAHAFCDSKVRTVYPRGYLIDLVNFRMQVGIYVCMHICTHVCMYICKYMYACMYVHM